MGVQPLHVTLKRLDAIAGALLGCAVGDALGLPYEGLSKRRAARLLGPPDRYRFVAGRGMVSDDTEHTCMAAQSLCAAPSDPDLFAREFARRLRWWLVGVPAGIGFATLRATLKLCFGRPPSRSGVYSAGNGPAMRSPILGAAIEDVDGLKPFVQASTRITHIDPRAYQGAFAAALAAWCARRGLDSPAEFFDKCRSSLSLDDSDEFDQLLRRVESSLDAGKSTEDFAEQLGCGQRISGYVFETVPVALHSWLSHPRDFRLAVTTVIRCGGDADTTAAIVGGIVGAGVGSQGIPVEWLDGLWEWPRSVAWMTRLAEAVDAAISSGVAQPAPTTPPLVGISRNAAFLAIVMGHVARRWLPPY